MRTVALLSAGALLACAALAAVAIAALRLYDAVDELEVEEA